MASQAAELFVRTIQATGLSYARLGREIGVSAKTVQRTVAGRSHPLPAHLHHLAALVHPKDRALAVRLAAAGGMTLEALGLERAGRALAAGAAGPLSAAQADTVVCAAADIMDVSPRAIRPALAAAFVRALELGFTLDDLARSFAAPGRPVKAAKAR